MHHLTTPPHISVNACTKAFMQPIARLSHEASRHLLNMCSELASFRAELCAFPSSLPSAALSGCCRLFLKFARCACTHCDSRSLAPNDVALFMK
jgi:hypothetical protein